MKKHITAGRVLIASFVIFIICMNIPYADDGKPQGLAAFFGVISFFSMPVCLVLMIIKAFRKKKIPTAPQPTQQPIQQPQPEPIVRKVETVQINEENTQAPPAPEPAPQPKQKKLSFFGKIIQEAKERKQQKILEEAERRRQKELEEEERIRVQEENEYKRKNYSNIRYKMVDGVAIIWEGETKTASFRIYDNPNRLSGAITKLTLNEDGRFYITLTDNENGTNFVANERELETMILIGSTRYEFVDLCRKVLKIDLSEMFGFAQFVRDELYKPRLMVTIDPPQKVVFSHYTSGENSRDLFIVEEYYKSNSNEEYLKIQVSSSGQELMVPVKKITTMIQLEDGKKIKLEEWLQNISKQNQVLESNDSTQAI